MVERGRGILPPARRLSACLSSKASRDASHDGALQLTAQACPNAFELLRCLLVGASETMEAVRRTAPPQTCLHMYDPAEGTTLTTAHLLTLDEVRGIPVAIGRPIANTQCQQRAERSRWRARGATVQDGVAICNNGQPLGSARASAPTTYRGASRDRPSGEVLG